MSDENTNLQQEGTQNVIVPKTRLEYFLAKIAGLPTGLYGEIEPATRLEEYLSAIAERLNGGDGEEGKTEPKG